ncbi:MAG: hypothetical protein XD98_0281 [Microgenomates bacterium 39_6]|nr:MAG: hypothetical protein XD98_0281 [Microgenomates bacterium 39_6]
MRKKQTNWFKIALIFILVAFGLISFWGLGRDFLYDWDEGIYAQVARESGLSLVLKWNGQPWFEKPPLLFWLTALSFNLGGETELAVRFWMPILGLICLVFTYLLIKIRSSSKVALLSLTFFFLAPLFLARSRGLNTDILLLALSLASLYFLSLLEKKIEDKQKLNFFDYCLPALFVGLAIMSKGILGLLPLAIWFGYLLLANRKVLRGNIKVWLIIALLVFLVSAPWHIYMLVRFGDDFWQVYFNEHVFRRLSQPVEYHFGGKLYYIKFLIGEFSWWLLPMVVGGLISFLSLLRKKKTNRNIIFFFFWGALVFLLFTFSQTKLSWYILPLYPVLAFFWGYFWNKLLPGKKLFLFLVLCWGLWFLFSQKSKVEKTAAFPQPSPKVNLAITAADICSSPLLFLVDQNERTARDILPEELQLSSSFIYGGSPAVVFYYQDQVEFFYDPTKFHQTFLERQAFSIPDTACAIIVEDDYHDLKLSGSIIKQADQWLLIK